MKDWTPENMEELSESPRASSGTILLPTRAAMRLEDCTDTTFRYGKKLTRVVEDVRGNTIEYEMWKAFLQPGAWINI